MRRVKIAELKDHLSEHLRAVEEGAAIEVTHRDRPVARLVPVPQDAEVVHLIPARRSFQSVRDERHRPTRWPISSTELLAEERRER